MDSNMNFRHAQVHSADLHRRSELHRLAAQGRQGGRFARPSRAPRLQPAGVSSAVRAMLSRFGSSPGAAAALGSKTPRA
jgi:hypothetical protein